jgi:hypothetical protein
VPIIPGNVPKTPLKLQLASLELGGSETNHVNFASLVIKKASCPSKPRMLP